MIMYSNGKIRLRIDNAAKFSANFIGIFLISGIGQITRIPKTLNSRWAKATATGATEAATRLARIAVMVVPMLEPRV